MPVALSALEVGEFKVTLPGKKQAASQGAESLLEPWIWGPEPPPQPQGPHGFCLSDTQAHNNIFQQLHSWPEWPFLIHGGE